MKRILKMFSDLRELWRDCRREARIEFYEGLQKMHDEYERHDRLKHPEKYRGK